MKKILRLFAAFLILFPFIILFHAISIFSGSGRAAEIIGPKITLFAKFFVKRFVPKIKDASEFDLLKSKFPGIIKLWKPLYDASISYADKDTIRLKISNCPICELLPKLGALKLNPFVCQGDWEFAKENRGKWAFERIHQIGTGDSFCDHTYRRQSC